LSRLGGFFQENDSSEIGKAPHILARPRPTDIGHHDIGVT